MMALDFNDAEPQGAHANITELPAVRKARILRGLQGRIRDFVRDLYPRAAGLNSATARIGGAHGEPGQSLAIVLSPPDKAGLWKEFNGGGNVRDSGDVFDLYAIAHNMDRRDFNKTMDACEAWLGGSPPDYMQQRTRREASKPPAPVETEEVVRTFPYLSSTEEKLFEACRIEYRDERGERVMRENGKAKKIYRPRRLDGSWGYPPGQWPLYRIPDIDRAQEIVLVEGEPCADALHDLGITATTAPGGSSVTPDKIDWRPLAGKSVILWPDKDEPGLKLMARVADHLRSIGCAVRLLTPPAEKPEKWDAADAAAEAFDIQAFLAAPAASDHGFRGEWLKDISHHAMPELVEGLLPATGLGFLYGPSSGGKSFIAISWALLIASGQRVLDLPTLPSGVLYIAAEGHAGLRKRLVAARRHLNLDDVEIPFNYLPAFINLGSPDSREVDRVLQYARECSEDMRRLGAPLRLIIIDTMAAAAPGVDELTGKDMGPLIARFQHLAAELDCLVMPVAHTGKDESKGLRGWSGSRAAADVAIECRVEREDDEDRESPVRRRYVWFEKAKDGPCGFTLADYRLAPVEVGTKPSGQPDTTCIVQYSAPAAPSPAAVAEEIEREARERLEGLRRAVLDGIAAALDDGWMAARETAIRLQETGGIKIGRSKLIDILQTFASARQDDLQRIAHAGVTIEVRTQRSDSRTTLHFRVNRDA